MQVVRGQVVVKENGKGLSGLLVVVYDVDPAKATSNRLVEAARKANADFWMKIPGRRLGSVATGTNGQFELQYDSTVLARPRPRKGGSVQRDGQIRLNLALFVVAPEDVDRPCPSVLHVSCGVRTAAAPTEHFLIRISVNRLREAGVTGVGPREAPIQRSDLDGIITQLRDVDRERQRRRLGALSFSRHFRARRAKELARLGEQESVARPAMSFQFAVGASQIGGEALPEGARVFYDAGRKSLMFQAQGDAASKPLAFAGVQQVAASNPGRRPTTLVIDVARGEYSLQIARIPDGIALAEQGVSDLYRWYVDVLRRTRRPASETDR